MYNAATRMGLGKTLELSDIYDAVFCEIIGIQVETIKRAGRVYWLVPADQRTYEALAGLREDPLVPALTFIRHLKKMRAVMLDYRANENGKERQHRSMEHGNKDL